MRVFLDADQLAQHGAEANGISNAALACFAVVECAFCELGLRFALQEQDLGGIDGVSLHATDVQEFAYVHNAHHVAM